jgi:RNA polymerase sigma factor (sigma-70 family)
MQDMSDAQLLRDYAEHGIEAAFSEIIVRHTDLVYSAALRQVSSPDLACDVAQEVFSALASKAWPLADNLAGGGSLVGWLYRSTRFAALNHLRDDRRRLAHEQQAMEQLTLNSETAPSWDCLRPILDEAMASLNDEDREALLLRFFKRHDFHAVGVALGVGDNAAQKRVSRALEKLRQQLARRGITSPAAALSAVITANAVQAAPAGLAASISTAAVLAGTKITTTVTTTKAIAMTVFQKALISAIVVATVGAPLVVQHQAQGRLHHQEESVRQQADQLAQLATDIQRLSNLLVGANGSGALSEEQLRELLKLRGEVGLLRKQTQELAQSSTGASTKKVWASRVDQLKQWLEANPSEKILELQFLTDQDWVNSIYPHTFENLEEYRQAMSTVRANAESRFMNKLHAAFRQYARSNNGQLPTDLSQLKTYLDSPIDDAILQRYEIAAATNLVRELQAHGDWVITQKAPVNEALDMRQALGLDTGGKADSRVTNRWMSAH